MSHNTFGHLFRVTTFGESHGPALGCVVDGCPPLIPLAASDIQADLDRRRPGQSRFTTQRREPDEVKILSGVFIDERSGEQVTTGTPIALLIENVDQRSKDYSEIKDRYRPGHADFTYDIKYGIRDYRGGGRSSARETAARVAAGAIARKVIPDIRIRGALVQMGPHAIDRSRLDWDEVHRNPFFCPDAADGGLLRGLSRRPAQGGLLDRRGDRGRGGGRAGGPRCADLWQARRGACRCPDVDQRREGRRDRGRIRRCRLARRGERRRDARRQCGAADLPVEPCGRHPRRDFERPACRLPICREADILDPDPTGDRDARAAARRKSSPRAATTLASASAPSRSAKPWWPASSRTSSSAIARRSAISANGRRRIERRSKLPRSFVGHF